jgi:amino acid transporter
MFAPPSIQKFLSYITGWLCFTGWQTGIAATAYLEATIIQGLIVLNNSRYVFERWHGTFLTVGVTIFCPLFNTFLAGRLPYIQSGLGVFHVIGFFVVISVLWALSPKTPAPEVWLDFQNSGGWSTTGGATIIGFVAPALAMFGMDSAVHMSEEVTDAGGALPRSILWQVFPTQEITANPDLCFLGPLASISFLVLSLLSR